jgi:hypothetical protein
MPKTSEETRKIDAVADQNECIDMCTSTGNVAARTRGSECTIHPSSLESCAFNPLLDTQQHLLLHRAGDWLYEIPV